MNTLKDKKILVTGGTGSIGSEIVKQLISYEPKTIRVLARGEYGHHQLSQSLEVNQKKIRFIVGDVRDKERLKLAMEDVDVVFHAAAKKHVDICEDNPFEAVKTNILGTQNIIDLARELDVEKVIAISTDKAVEPEGVMGTSKLMAEKLILSSYNYKGDKKTKFSCVRFGNVLGSRGSILPLLKNQIRHRNHVTITDPEMTRFIMTISQAVNLVLRASELTRGNEIFVLKMPAVKIIDLINGAIRYYAPLFSKKSSEIEIRVIGLKNGERRHEKLMARHEFNNALETENMYILTPNIKIWGYGVYNKSYPDTVKIKSKNLSSDHVPKLNIEEITQLIKEVDKNNNYA